MFIEVAAIIPLEDFITEKDIQEEQKQGDILTKIYLDSMVNDYFVFQVSIVPNVPVPLQVEFFMSDMGIDKNDWAIVSDVMMPL